MPMLVVAIWVCRTLPVSSFDFLPNANSGYWKLCDARGSTTESLASAVAHGDQWVFGFGSIDVLGREAGGWPTGAGGGAEGGVSDGWI